MTKIGLISIYNITLTFIYRYYIIVTMTTVNDKEDDQRTADSKLMNGSPHDDGDTNVNQEQLHSRTSLGYRYVFPFFSRG